MGNKMFGAVLAVVVSAGMLCAGSAEAAPVSSLKWQPCQENSAFECTTLPVPIDWANPGGAGIDFAVVIDRADDPSRRIGTLISLPGGPGSSGYSRSYGTMSAQAYAELFPQHLRASLLDSVDDHSLDGAAFMASEARAGQDTFEEFASWCSRDAGCALHGTDVRAIYRALWDAAIRGELRTPGKPDRPLRALELSQRITQRLYHPDWAELATDLQTLTATPKDTPEPVHTPHATGVPTPFPAIIACSDWQFDIPDQTRWQSLWNDQRTNAPTLGAHFAWAAGTLCSAWPTPPANPPHRPTVRNAPPTLILNSRHDPATPLEWAIQVAARTPATLLTYDGWGHGIYDRNPCTTAAADRYLIDLTLPVTASCPA